VLLGFHSKQLGERGTEVALFDHAREARDLLAHEVLARLPRRRHPIPSDVAERYSESAVMSRFTQVMEFDR
jgi:hypothetical protein